MATFGSFAGLAAAAVGALSSSEAQLLGLYDFSACSSGKQSSSQVNTKLQDSKHCAQGPAKKGGLLSQLNVANLAPELNGIGCFDTVFG
ncbi:hypothetical protein KP509_27G027800 [Ceratopteris richardii]|uniref:Uncharacterized protein n=1 Tax=Ceratopteris richardii TaxID=49495 RepID=A0A8T2RHG1_CERRI|nr:hypothetical protein KP509_27G027800 [Ceratopteris richardii]